MASSLVYRISYRGGGGVNLKIGLKCNGRIWNLLAG